MKLSIVFGVLALTSMIHGYKILCLGPFNGKNHFLSMKTFIEKLLERSHEVTFVTSNSIGKNIENYTEVLIDPPLELSSLFTPEELYEGSNKSPFTIVNEIYTLTQASTEYSLSSKNVQDFIHRKDLHFDLVINEEFFHDAFSLFGFKFNAPIITICPYGNSDFFERQQGLMTPWSYVPHMTLTYSDNMSFYERLHNTILSVYDWFVRENYHFPAQNRIALKHFGHLGPLPLIEEINRNVSLIMVNTHRSISPPRPTLPNIVSIGGAHLKAPKPLPDDMKQFLDESTDGAIFFSLGTIMQVSKMPKKQFNAFINVFKKLKQRVLWKLENETIPNIPSNVMVRKWFPQNDILAHPNVKVFMTHSGLFGTSEAVANGVPMIMIPFFGDQYRNAKRVVNAGYGKIIHFKDINEDALHDIINEVATNDSYENRAKELSAIYNHNLVNPLDEMMWWIEYVCKFKGANHLQSHGENMPWYSIMLLDVFAVIFLALSVVSFLLSYLIIFAISESKTFHFLSEKKLN